MNEEEEKKDPEEELKEEKERYERQNQEGYDEQTKANEELRRRAEEEQKRIDDILEDRPGETSIERRRRISRQMGRYYKGKKVLPPDADIQTEGNLKGQPKPEDIFGPNYKRKPTYLDDPKDEEDTNPRFAESIGFEVGANVALDKATAPLLAAPIPGARALYAISNVAGTGIINYLAQRIRGTEFSLGELATASGLSLIPGATQAKTLKGAIGKSTVKGAGLGATQVTSESLIDTGELPDAETFATGALFGGAAGGIFETATKGDDIGKFLNNVRNRINGGKQLITPEGIPIDASDFKPSTAFAIKGKDEGLTPEEIKKATDVSRDEFNKSLQPKSKLEAGTDLANIKKDVDAINQFNQKQYDIAKQLVFGDTQDFKISKADIRKMKTNARRKLKLNDVKKVQAKLNDPNITDEVVQNYYNDAVRSELGYTGTAGTIDFLNDMMDAPSRKAFTSVDDFIANSRVGQSSIEDILDDMSFKLETPISKEKLQNLLDGTETYSFQTSRMRKKGEAPIVINDIKSLQKAYFARLLALDDIAEFEKGHINAVDQIIERFLRGEKITPTASFKDNTNPEIARSIYKLVGNEEAFDAMVDINKDYIVKGLTDRDLKFAQVFAGNRSRKANQDLDRVVNSIFGTEPDLESSLLSYVYPERSLNAMVDPSMKVTFAQVYMKELDELIQALLDQGAKMEDIGPNVLEGYRQRALETTLESFPPDLSKDMGGMLDAYLQLNKIDTVDEFGNPKF